MIISELLGAVPIRLVRRLDNGCSVVVRVLPLPALLQKPCALQTRLDTGACADCPLVMSRLRKRGEEQACRDAQTCAALHRNPCAYIGQILDRLRILFSNILILYSYLCERAVDLRREVAQKRRLFCNPVRWDRIALPPDEIQHFDDVVEMTLGIDAARKREPD